MNSKMFGLHAPLAFLALLKEHLTDLLAWATSVGCAPIRLPFAFLFWHGSRPDHFYSGNVFRFHWRIALMTAGIPRQVKFFLLPIFKVFSLLFLAAHWVEYCLANLWHLYGLRNYWLQIHVKCTYATGRFLLPAIAYLVLAFICQWDKISVWFTAYVTSEAGVANQLPSSILSSVLTSVAQPVGLVTAYKLPLNGLAIFSPSEPSATQMFPSLQRPFRRMPLLFRYNDVDFFFKNVMRM